MGIDFSAIALGFLLFIVSVANKFFSERGPKMWGSKRQPSLLGIGIMAAIALLAIGFFAMCGSAKAESPITNRIVVSDGAPGTVVFTADNHAVVRVAWCSSCEFATTWHIYPGHNEFRFDYEAEGFGSWIKFQLDCNPDFGQITEENHSSIWQKQGNDWVRFFINVTPSCYNQDPVMHVTGRIEGWYTIQPDGYDEFAIGYFRDGTNLNEFLSLRHPIQGTRSPWPIYWPSNGARCILRARTGSYEEGPNQLITETSFTFQNDGCTHRSFLPFVIVTSSR